MSRPALGLHSPNQADQQLAFASDFHGRNALVPARDDLTCADRKRKWPSPVHGAVEFLTLGSLPEPAGIVHDARLAAFRNGAFTHLDVAILEAAFGLLHDTQEFNLEQQGWIRRNHSAGAASTIGQARGYQQLALPPTFMVPTPSSHPLMTRPSPTGKANGAFRSRELSNFLPFALFSQSQPV